MKTGNTQAAHATNMGQMQTLVLFSTLLTLCVSEGEWKCRAMGVDSVDTQALTFLFSFLSKP